MPVFPIEPRYFLLDSFLPDVEMNFDLVILKTEALGRRPIVELLNFCLRFANSLRNTAVFLLKGTL